MLDHVLQFKGESKEVNNEIVEYNLYMLLHNGSGFDRYVVLNNLPQLRTVVEIIRNGSSVVSLKVFNGYEDENKTIPEFVRFRCGLMHVKDSLKNIGKLY